MPFVVTVRRRPGRPGSGGGAALPGELERIAEDEFQGVVTEPQAVVATVLRLLRGGGWSVGVGAGPVQTPPSAGGRTAAGPAFLSARGALDAAGRRPARVAVRGVVASDATDAQAVLGALAVVVERRSAQAWEAIDLVEGGRTQAEAAAALGISRQAVGQRLAAGLWELERELRPAAAGLLERAAG